MSAITSLTLLRARRLFSHVNNSCPRHWQERGTQGGNDPIPAPEWESSDDDDCPMAAETVGCTRSTVREPAVASVAQGQRFAI
jgi:hypothetical protein